MGRSQVCECTDRDVRLRPPCGRRSRLPDAWTGQTSSYHRGVRALFIVDPLEQLGLAGDTSYALMLEAARGKTLLVNDPRGLRELNEHLAVLRFPKLTPPTIVTRSAERLRAFQREQGGTIVVKPVDGYGGLGVFIVREGDPNASSILESSTAI